MNLKYLTTKVEEKCKPTYFGLSRLEQDFLTFRRYLKILSLVFFSHDCSYILIYLCIHDHLHMEATSPFVHSDF